MGWKYLITLPLKHEMTSHLNYNFLTTNLNMKFNIYFVFEIFLKYVIIFYIFDQPGDWWVAAGEKYCGWHQDYSAGLSELGGRGARFWHICYLSQPGQSGVGRLYPLLSSKVFNSKEGVTMYFLIHCGHFSNKIALLHF